MKHFRVALKHGAASLALGALLSACGQGQQQQAPVEAKVDKPLPVVTVYSERKEHLIKPLFDAYTAKTGVPVRYITDKAAPLNARMQNEGEATPADIFMTVDAGSLWQAEEKGLLAPVNSEVLKANIPEHLRSQSQSWFGLSSRARTIVYATERVKPVELSTYEDLANPKWKGRLCLRTAKKVYNQSLVATMIKTQGVASVESTIKGWVENLATDPYSSDTLALEAVLAGQCDMAIVNTYYFGRMQAKDPQLALAVFWPNQQDRGVHVNVSGAGITKHAKNPAAAQALLEWLSGEEAQASFAQLNQEYPANPKAKPTPLVAAWGTFKADLVNVESAGRLQAEAIKLFDRVGYR